MTRAKKLALFRDNIASDEGIDDGIGIGSAKSNKPDDRDSSDTEGEDLISEQEEDSQAGVKIGPKNVEIIHEALCHSSMNGDGISSGDGTKSVSYR